MHVCIRQRAEVVVVCGIQASQVCNRQSIAWSTGHRPKGEQVMTRLPGQRGRSRLPSRRDIESDKTYGIGAVLFSGSVA